MIRIVATFSLRQALRLRDYAEDVIERIMRHGEVTVQRGGGQVYLDVLIDADPADIPPAVRQFLRDRPEVVYIADWDFVGEPTVYKGSDPGLHRFAGWVC